MADVWIKSHAFDGMFHLKDGRAAKPFLGTESIHDIVNMVAAINCNEESVASVEVDGKEVSTDPNNWHKITCFKQIIITVEKNQVIVKNGLNNLLPEINSVTINFESLIGVSLKDQAKEIPKSIRTNLVKIRRIVNTVTTTLAVLDIGADTVIVNKNSLIKLYESIITHFSEINILLGLKDFDQVKLIIADNLLVDLKTLPLFIKELLKINEKTHSHK